MKRTEDDEVDRATSPVPQRPRSTSADAPDWYELLAGITAITAQEIVDKNQALL